MHDVARILIFLGIIFLLAGGVILLLGKIPGLGRLPGDIIIERKSFTFYFPLTTCIVISFVLSLIFWLIGRR